MVNLPAVFIANGLGFMLMIILLISHYTKSRNMFLDDKLFFLMCFFTLCLCVFETVTFCIDGYNFMGARMLSRIVNALIFFTNAVFSAIWVVYVDYKLFGNVEALKKKIKWIFIPAGMICFLAIMNLFTDVFFTISADNIYSRTPLAYVNYVVTYGYLTAGAIIVIMNRKKLKKYMFMPVILFLTPVYVGSFIQMMCYGIALIWVSVAFGLTSLYLNLQNEATFLDSLTKLYNREYMIRYLSYMDNQSLYGMMIDINSFKSINDTYGHLEGDFVLKVVADILLKNVGKQGIAVRQGGDEFLVITKTKDENDMKAMKEKICQNLEDFQKKHQLPYHISLSIGIGTYDGRTQNIDDFLKAIDQKMYEEKRLYYSSQGHDRRLRRGDQIA